MKKRVYLFEEGSAEQRQLLGGKGANLAEMTRIGLPVPPGITITTETCLAYYKAGKKLPPGLDEEIRDGIKILEEKLGKKFGDPENPLLVSVRSGAAISMPGMMDTILNLGLNDKTREGLARLTGDRRFANDCYRRFIQMFGDVVMGVSSQAFEGALEEIKQEVGAESDTELTAENLEDLIKRFKEIYTRATGEDFPQDPFQQLLRAVEAVFASWNTERAIVYRRVHRIPDDLGTAVNIQTMVFGNMGNDSGTGVAFTRNPATGEKKIYGEYLVNAQGEDVVAGIRTPKPIASLQEEMPEIYQQFVEISQRLEDHYRDLQDIEFTIEKAKLYILQTRAGKRTAAAAIKVATDLVQEGKITEEEAVLRVDPEQLDQLMHPSLDPEAKVEVLAKGLPASPGAAVGKVVFSADLAEELGEKGEKVILVRPETTPDDIHGIVMAQGILTSRGGMTSHAAVVARGMGKPCICGCEALRIDLGAKGFTVDGVTVKEGDMLTIDGATGRVMLGEAKLVSPQIGGAFQTILEWADKIRHLQVRTNADTPEDAARAREFGAEGIGLCRTEHMFMAQDRLPVVQQMNLAENDEERKAALEKLLPVQQGDFYGILKAMQGLPVTIRLLDPPLHEFLPNAEELLVEITRLEMTGDNPQLLAEKQRMLRLVRNLSEFNPMLGHRGCRLGITFPEIYEMQARAIFNAVAALVKEGVEVYPEVMIPLVGHPKELEPLRELVVNTAEAVKQEEGVDFPYTVGTMIELPRACVVADEIAEHADFFSFGTNDLTQTTFGFSRDDAEGKFLQHYLQKKILPENPFAVLDTEGVGKLVAQGVKLGRSAKPNLKVGVCGEHGGDPRSIAFFHQTGLNYVSCSPFRVPIARLAAAQAQITNPRE
ncbi:MAG TPA: pyruvate, phosphate dikinase [Firmicutes bacterium]|nr:pyruvate, phosphate dikinase [Bacillota bacterium]